MGEINLTEMAIMIIVLGLVVSIGAVILTNYQDSVSETASESASETILADNASTTTLTQTPSTLTATAKNNSWLSFDGVNDNVAILEDNFLSNPNLNMTLSIWVNISGSPDDSSENHTVLFSRNSASRVNGFFDQYELSLGNGSSNLNKSACFGYQNGTVSDTTQFVCSTGNLSENIWHNIVGVHNGSSILLYIDGILNNSQWIDGYYTSLLSATAKIGGGSITNGYYLNGSLDELRIYNISSTALTVEIYGSGRVANSSVNSTNLIFWTPMNENSGTDIHSFNQSDFT